MEHIPVGDIVIGLDEKIPFGYSGTCQFVTKDGIIVYLYDDEFTKL